MIGQTLRVDIARASRRSPSRRRGGVLRGARDPHLIVVDKPADWLSIMVRVQRGTLVDGLLSRFPT